MFHLFQPSQHNAPDTILTDCAALMDFVSNAVGSATEENYDLSNGAKLGISILTNAVANGLRDLEYVFKAEMGKHFAMGLLEGKGNASPRSEARTALVGKTIADLERDLILDTMQYCSGDREKAVAILGISPRSLGRRLKSYGVIGQRGGYRPNHRTAADAEGDDLPSFAQGIALLKKDEKELAKARKRQSRNKKEKQKPSTPSLTEPARKKNRAAA